MWIPGRLTICPRGTVGRRFPPLGDREARKLGTPLAQLPPLLRVAAAIAMASALLAYGAVPILHLGVL